MLRCINFALLLKFLPLFPETFLHLAGQQRLCRTFSSELFGRSVETWKQLRIPSTWLLFAVMELRNLDRFLLPQRLQNFF